MKICIGILLVFSFYASAEAAPTAVKVVTFEDLSRLVKEKNENVQAAQSSLNAEKKRTGYLTRSFLPHISADAGGENFKTGKSRMESQNYWNVQAKLNIYRGGRDSIESSVRDANVRVAGTEFQNEYRKELKEARRTFWKLIAVGKLIDDRNEAIKKNDLNLTSARRRAGAGVATTADALQFELHKTLLTQDLKKLQIEQDLLRNRLSVAIGLDSHEGLRVENVFPHPEEEFKSVNLKVENNLDVKALRDRENILDLKRKYSSRWWLPKVDVYSSYGLPSLSDEYERSLRRDNEFVAGVRIGIDLGEGIEASQEAAARRLEAEALQLRAQYKSREVVAVHHELEHDLQLLHELIHDADKDIERSEKFLKLTEDEYRRGIKNGPDLLGAFQKLYEFRQRRTELYRDYFETKAELTALVAG